MSMETLLSCFTQLFLSTGAKVPQERKLKGTKVVCGAKVPRVRKFHGTKVVGTFAPEERKFHSPERKFHGMKVLGLFAPRERMFLETKVPQERKFSLQIWSFRCWERKCIGTKRPVTRVRPVRRSEIGKIGTHQKIGESDMCTVRFRFVCGRHAASGGVSD